MTQRLFFVFITFLLASQLCAQTRDTVSVAFKDKPLEVLLDSISSQSGYFFSYNADIMPQGSLFTIYEDEMYIDELLEKLFIGTHLEFTKIEDQIILRRVIRDNQGNKRLYSKISGWVHHSKSGEPIFGAHVFINGSTIGTYTDVEGKYELTDLKPGNYQVVFSHVGFKPAAYEINSTEPANYAINAELNEQVNVLADVQVTSLPLVSEDNWVKYYRKFSEEFIGSSNNSNRCSFENPEILEFSYSDSLDAYEAIAAEPLIMLNTGLGYRVTFELDYFRSSPKETRFHVRASFEPLVPENRRIKKRWKKNRERSYYGSSFHFFRSLMNDQLKSEGYQIYLSSDVEKLTASAFDVTREDIIYIANSNYYLKFDDYLVVRYTKEFQHPSYQETVSGSKMKSTPTLYYSSSPKTNLTQQSVVLLNDDKVRILRNGQITKPEQMQALGYWSWERMSELMPIDYDPKSDNILQK